MALAKHKSTEKVLCDGDLKQLEAKIELLQRYKNASNGDPDKDELLEKFKNGSKTKNWVVFQEGYEKTTETENSVLDGYGTRFPYLNFVCLCFL